MGSRNSSVTRVWPVFDFLLRRDPTGLSWLPKLLAWASSSNSTDVGALHGRTALREREIPATLRRVLGPQNSARIGKVPNAFEEELPPSTAFLKWLVENPSELSWPMADGKPAVYGAQTQRKRQALMAGERPVQKEALAELEAGQAAGSRRKWWAFEGYTSVDCYLETERLVLLIEGKRTEPIAPSTSWFPKRNQIMRNVEAARAVAGDREFAVLLCTEVRTSLPEHCWADSLPHLGEEERQQLRRHYLGCVLWGDLVEALCPGLRLPDTIDEAVPILTQTRGA